MELTASRKGYVHALEGVIAALIVVVYLNSIVSVPSTTDWETARISKESEDMLAALDRSGFMDRVVLQNDPESFNAFVNTLSSSASYSIQVSGLPKQFIDVGVLAPNSSTVRAETAAQETQPPGVPASVDSSGFRTGTVTGDGFNNLDIALADTVKNGITGFSTVSVDLDDDGDFSGPGEGPYNFSERFTCDGTDTGCTFTEIYEFGPFNTTVPVYNASTAAGLSSKISEMEIGRRTVNISFDAVNPFDERLTRFDTLWIENLDAGGIAEHSRHIENFLRRGRMLLIHSSVDRAAIDANYLGELGFDYIQEYQVDGSDNRNVLFSLHGPRNESYRPAQYYLDGGIRITDFTGSGGFDTASFTLRGQDITARRWDDQVSFSTSAFQVNHSTGSRATITGNTYRIDTLRPLVLEPVGQQTFDTFNTERVDAEYHLTRMAHRTYNITQYDRTADYDNQFEERSDLPGQYSDGPVNTPCDPDDNPYRLGDITVDGTSYTFIMVNFEPEQPCDGYYEFLYMDLNDDGDVDDDSLSESSHEGPYQEGYRINISGEPYEVSLSLDGTEIKLTRIGQRLVGEIPVSRDMFGRGGAAALVRRPALGHDDAALLTALMARETQEQQAFTAPRTLGDTSIGYTRLSSAGRKNTFGYTLETVWWFQ
ncbi:MAG: hypothetical protein SVY41_00335 [Candidatus Nanohaloarchaea archaeon]|nr:hypothetical protein [Candidatus Nanohaloarchaea archaeon]